MGFQVGPLKLTWGEQNANSAANSKAVFAVGAVTGVAATVLATYATPIVKPYAVDYSARAYVASAAGCSTVASAVRRLFGQDDTVVVVAVDNKTAAPAPVRTWSDTMVSVFTLGLK